MASNIVTSGAEGAGLGGVGVRKQLGGSRVFFSHGQVVRTAEVSKVLSV